MGMETMSSVATAATLGADKGVWMVFTPGSPPPSVFGALLHTFAWFWWFWRPHFEHTWPLAGHSVGVWRVAAPHVQQPADCLDAGGLFTFDGQGRRPLPPFCSCFSCFAFWSADVRVP